MLIGRCMQATTVYRPLQCTGRYSVHCTGRYSVQVLSMHLMIIPIIGCFFQLRYSVAVRTLPPVYNLGGLCEWLDSAEVSLRCLEMKEKYIHM